MFLCMYVECALCAREWHRKMDDQQSHRFLKRTFLLVQLNIEEPLLVASVCFVPFQKGDLCLNFLIPDWVAATSGVHIDSISPGEGSISGGTLVTMDITTTWEENEEVNNSCVHVVPCSYDIL